jgi:hypothetical protein
MAVMRSVAGLPNHLPVTIPICRATVVGSIPDLYADPAAFAIDGTRAVATTTAAIKSLCLIIVMSDSCRSAGNACVYLCQLAASSSSLTFYAQLPPLNHGTKYCEHREPVTPDSRMTFRSLFKGIAARTWSFGVKRRLAARGFIFRAWNGAESCVRSTPRA